MSRWACRAILFDLFDTLCQIDPDLYLAGKQKAAARLGLPAAEFLQAWVAAGDEAQVGLIADAAARVRRAAALLGAPPPEEAAVREVVETERALLARATRLHPDVLPALEGLAGHGDRPMALVSNASSGAVELFEGLGLARFFAAAIWSFRVGVAKPDPAIYLAACEAIGRPPGDCLFVGDGNALELDGARALGMRAVRIERRFSIPAYRREESRSFDASIDDLRRLADLLAPASSG
ncbi:MAG TPA: HAD family hydrolase [Dongiaceae bacterium]|nr:HAD family hydrolase [Dongiaceae bacterium]